MNIQLQNSLNSLQSTAQMIVATNSTMHDLKEKLRNLHPECANDHVEPLPTKEQFLKENYHPKPVYEPTFKAKSPILLIVSGLIHIVLIPFDEFMALPFYFISMCIAGTLAIWNLIRFGDFYRKNQTAERVRGDNIQEQERYIEAYKELCAKHKAKTLRWTAYLKQNAEKVSAQYEASKKEIEQQIGRYSSIEAGYITEYRNIANEIGWPYAYYEKRDVLNNVIAIVANGRADSVKEALNIEIADVNAKRQRELAEEQVRANQERNRLEKLNIIAQYEQAEAARREREELINSLYEYLEEQDRSNQRAAEEAQQAREDAVKRSGERQCASCTKYLRCSYRNSNEGHCTAFEPTKSWF